MWKNRLRRTHFLIVALVAGTAAVAHSVAADAPCDQYVVQPYVIQNDGTVYDTKTGLVWQQSPTGGGMTWNAAVNFCNSAANGSLPGCGWRLPSVKELQSLVDDSRSNPAIEIKAFPIVDSSEYWTSTVAKNNAQAWTVAFFYGLSNTLDFTTHNSALCVR
jgi:hypothetical protein